MTAPDSIEQQLRIAVAKYASGRDRVEAVLAVANPAAFTGPDGRIDDAAVAQHLSTLFTEQPGGRWANFGQHQPPPWPPGPGDRGRAEAQRRFGSPGADAAAPASSRGAAGRAEAARRFGKRDT
jgi:hypothetical protein